MPINLDNVTQIMHGDKEVIKIEDSHGVIWEKAERPTASATISVTVGASQNITTTQHYNYITIPSLNSIKSYIESNTSRSLKGITTVGLYNLYFLRQYYTNAYYVRGFLLNGNTTSSDIIYKMSGTTQFPSGSGADYGKTLIGTSTSSAVDITSYLSSNNTKNIYGAYSGASTGSSVPQTPTTMFSSTTGYQKTYFKKYVASAVPTFTLYVTYEYYTD